MNATQLIGRMLGIEQAQSIEHVRPTLAAPWVQGGSGWLLFGVMGLAALAILFYTRYQQGRRVKARTTLAVFRALLLSLLLLILAEPILTVRVTSRLRPPLWLLFDGSDSMGIPDEMTESERRQLAKALGLADEDEVSDDDGATGIERNEPPVGRNSGATRSDYVKALIKNKHGNWLGKLAREFRLKAFIFDRPDGVRALELSPQEDDRIDPEYLADQLTTAGQVTALGSAFEDLARRHASSNLAGLVVFSDFNQNAGPAALEAAKQLGVDVYTVGLGPIATTDVDVDLHVPPVMKKDERSSLVATVRQEGLGGETIEVSFSVRRLGDSSDETNSSLIDRRTVRLTGPAETVELPYFPTETGKFLFTAEVQPLEGEAVGDNNKARREATVRDDFIRLLFVEYEPTWEWRFVKEVFHRDTLVGMRGFRTFLRSADRKVRKTNELFLESLAPPRSEFFANDVIVLGDMPASALSVRFCQMTEEFVDDFGGGLVVLAGPRFGPGQLAHTRLADLLPVKVDPNARLRDREPFVLQRTADAAQYDFMQLGASGRENEKAWDNLGPLAWYQPVQRLRPLATALAEHPNETCVDGETPQPLVAVTNYGRGEVVYLGFNETWRLRRRHGELYYRQFWGQLIHRLALRHALGAQKRFVVRTDRRRYRTDDNVLLTVEACDADFEPLTEEDVPGRKLQAELILPGPGLPGDNVRPMGISQLRDGVFEARIPVFAEGEHRIRVKDPVTEEYVDVSFRVASVSVERQRAVRNVALWQAVADSTGGRSYDLSNVHRLPDEIDLVSRTETTVEVISLWNTWLCFACVILLMLGEWLLRKWVNLP